MAARRFMGERLKSARQTAHLSQRELADLAGMSQGTVARLERNMGRAPRLGTIRGLAAALRVDPETLLGWHPLFHAPHQDPATSAGLALVADDGDGTANAASATVVVAPVGPPVLQARAHAVSARTVALQERSRVLQERSASLQQRSLVIHGVLEDLHDRTDALLARYG